MQTSQKKSLHGSKCLGEHVIASATTRGDTRGAAREWTSLTSCVGLFSKTWRKCARSAKKRWNLTCVPQPRPQQRNRRRTPQRARTAGLGVPTTQQVAAPPSSAPAPSSLHSSPYSPLAQAHPGEPRRASASLGKPRFEASGVTRLGLGANDCSRALPHTMCEPKTVGTSSAGHHVAISTSRQCCTSQTSSRPSATTLAYIPTFAANWLPSNTAAGKGAPLLLSAEMQKLQAEAHNR